VFPGRDSQKSITLACRLVFPSTVGDTKQCVWEQSKPTNMKTTFSILLIVLVGLSALNPVNADIFTRLRGVSRENRVLSSDAAEGRRKAKGTSSSKSKDGKSKGKSKSKSKSMDEGRCPATDPSLSYSQPAMCDPDQEGLQCSYGEESCCDETFAATICECTADGFFVCRPTEACRVPACICPFVSPLDPMGSDSCTTAQQGLQCTYGTETCCGETFPSTRCTCEANRFICMPTEACQRPACANP